MRVRRPLKADQDPTVGADRALLSCSPANEPWRHFPPLTPTSKCCEDGGQRSLGDPAFHSFGGVYPDVGPLSRREI